MSTEIYHYHTIAHATEAEFSDRGSRFIAIAMPVESIEQFKENLLSVKEKHPKASHYCFAYRIGADGMTFRSSDAGEPSGTAGRPILGQIDSKQITNTMVVVARYFGGTLLGIPGLIHAYKMAASMALQLTPVVKKSIELSYEIQFDYTVMNDVLQALRNFQCTIVNQEVQLFCSYEIGIPKQTADECLLVLSKIPGVLCTKM
jgi:uncharacterized YigZ family protein